MSALLSPQMSLSDRAALCRRLATALSAGIDIRKVLAREAQQARGSAARRHLGNINAAIGQGETLSDSVVAAGDFFPPLFREMVEVGEKTGHQSEIFAQLAEHYESQVQLRRNFLSSITGPIIQLTIALFVVGFLIWIADFIGQMTGTKFDPLGFGLIGNRGLAIYLVILAAVGFFLFTVIRAASRGLVWVRPLQRIVMRIPVLGPAVQTIALARLAWSMHLTMNAGMELRRSLRLSLKSTQSAIYIEKAEQIDAVIAGGDSIYEAFWKAGDFPPHFLDSLQVGEQSGRLVETLELVSRQYQEQARAALATLTMLAGYAVWAVVALVIISLIFRLFGFYIGVLNGVMKG